MVGMHSTGPVFHGEGDLGEWEIGGGGGGGERPWKRCEFAQRDEGERQKCSVALVLSFSTLKAYRILASYTSISSVWSARQCRRCSGDEQGALTEDSCEQLARAKERLNHW